MLDSAPGVSGECSVSGDSGDPGDPAGSGDSACPGVPGISLHGARSSIVHDHVALAEIELCAELMIAAAAAEAAGEERLSAARIDEVLSGAGAVDAVARDGTAGPPAVS